MLSTFLNDFELTGQGKAQTACYNEQAEYIYDAPTEGAGEVVGIGVECAVGYSIANGLVCWVIGAGLDLFAAFRHHCGVFFGGTVMKALTGLDNNVFLRVGWHLQAG